MIVVSVQLLSALGSHRNRELARMEIVNDGTGDASVGNYMATTYRGRDTVALNRRVPSKRAHFGNWPRERLHVWNLVRYALAAMGYNKTGATKLHGLLDYEPVQVGWTKPDGKGGRYVYPRVGPSIERFSPARPIGTRPAPNRAD